MSFFMWDKETLGTVPGCVILSIGIIEFDPMAATIDELFKDEGKYVVINTEDCLQNFLHKDPETEQWWRDQTAKNPQAGEVVQLAKSTKTSIPLRLAITEVIDYVSGHCTPKKARVLGNGADFDNAIFNVAAHVVGIKTPWSYGGRCYRTLKNLDEFLGTDFKAPPVQRTGTYHHALDDAKTQAVHLWETLERIRSGVLGTR